MTFSWMAADAVTTLNVEPGSYRSWTARLRRATSDDIAILVRIERRLVGHRENLARVRIHDDRGAADPPVFDDSGVQFPFRNVLQVLVDGQLDGRAGRRRPLDPAEDLAGGVGLEPARHHQSPRSSLSYADFDAAEAVVFGAKIAD